MRAPGPPSAAVSRFQPSTDLRNPIIVAPVVVITATLARLALDGLLKTHGPYLFFAISVVIAALYAGKWAGFAAIVLSIPICDYLFIEPRYTWFIHDAPADSIMLALFGTLGVLTTLIIDRLHENRRRLKHSLVDLQRSELQLEMIDASVPEPIFTATETGVAEHLNGFFSKYSGRAFNSLLGRGWLDLVHPDDRDSFVAELTDRQKQSDQFEQVLRLRSADGTYRSFKCHATRNASPGNDAKTWFGVCSDIQNEKSLSEALKNRTQELTRLNQSLERFAYIASHDLQEPLRMVGALTERFLLRKQGELDVESSEILASVVKGADRMKRLIRDIMDMAKTANSAVESTVEIDMRGVAESAIANLGQAIAESGAKIVVGNLPSIRVSETPMVRVFQNLIGNAIKYFGDRRPQIYISAESRGEEYVFSIKDNGIGIDPKYRDKIFEPFQRLHTRSQYEGSGLGLAACRRIIQALNGRIWVDSTPSEGSTFFFTIPRSISDPGASVDKTLQSDQPHPPNPVKGGSDASKAFGTAHGITL